MKREDISELTLDDFSKSGGRSEEEIKRFYSLRQNIIDSGLYTMDPIRETPPNTTIQIERQTGEKFKLLNYV